MAAESVHPHGEKHWHVNHRLRKPATSLISCGWAREKDRNDWRRCSFLASLIFVPSFCGLKVTSAALYMLRCLIVGRQLTIVFTANQCASYHLDSSFVLENVRRRWRKVTITTSLRWLLHTFSPTNILQTQKYSIHYHVSQRKQIGLKGHCVVWEKNVTQNFIT